ncbi:unnamed protein product [Camellia sinensis]
MMEGMVKKYQQKFRKVKEEMSRWDELQSRLLSQFRNSSFIIQRLQVIQNPKNYGALKCIAGIEDLVLRKQMESLESILLSMNQTLQLVKAGSIQAAPKQLQQRIEYILKASIVSALSALALKPSAIHI